MSRYACFFCSVAVLLSGCLHIRAGAQGPETPSCFPTIAEAARGTAAAVSMSGVAGYRAQSLVVDTVLHRAWVNVQDCAHPERPATLVALQIPVNQTFSTSVQASLQRTQSPAIPGGQEVSVQVRNDAVHMDLRGKLLGAAHVGDTVEVVLSGTVADQGEPKHIRGRLIAPGLVEVRA